MKDKRKKTYCELLEAWAKGKRKKAAKLWNKLLRKELDARK